MFCLRGRGGVGVGVGGGFGVLFVVGEIGGVLVFFVFGGEGVLF